MLITRAAPAQDRPKAAGSGGAPGPQSLAWFGPPLVALGAALWATDSLFRSAVIGRYPAFFIVFVNHALSLIPAVFVLWQQRSAWAKLGRAGWTALIIVVVGGSVLGMAAFTKAFALASNVSVPILMQKLQPLIAMSLARLVLKERVSGRFGLWAALALVGAYLVSFGTTNAWTALTRSELASCGYALTAAVLWGGTTVAGKALLGHAGFFFVTAARFALGAVVLLCVVLWRGELTFLSQALTVDLRPFLGMAFLSGLIPLLIYYRGLRSTTASVATLCELAFPVAAIAVNWLFLASPLGAAQGVGALVLLVAITALTFDRRA